MTDFEHPQQGPRPQIVLQHAAAEPLGCRPGHITIWPGNAASTAKLDAEPMLAPSPWPSDTHAGVENTSTASDQHQQMDVGVRAAGSWPSTHHASHGHAVEVGQLHGGQGPAQVVPGGCIVASPVRRPSSRAQEGGPAYGRLRAPALGWTCTAWWQLKCSPSAGCPDLSSCSLGPAHASTTRHPSLAARPSAASANESTLARPCLHGPEQAAARYQTPDATQNSDAWGGRAAQKQPTW